MLSLVAAAHLRPGEQPWLADLALPGADGDWYAAGELLLPGGPLAEVIAADTPFGTVSPAILKRHEAATLEAVGVLSSFGLLIAEDVALDAPDLDLDGAQEWADDVCARLPGGDVPPVAAEVLAVRDLELVDPARWPRALELLAAPSLRAALVEPTRVLLADGRHADVPSYTAWWLRHHPVLGGQRPTEVRVAGTDPLLAGLYDETTLPADPAVAGALGVRTSLAELLAEPGRPGRAAGPAGRPRAAGDAGTVARTVDGARGRRRGRTAGPGTRGLRGRDRRGRRRATRWYSTPRTCGRSSPHSRSCWRHTTGPRGSLTCWTCHWSRRRSPAWSSRHQYASPVPAIVGAVLPDAPATYYAHDPLIVDGVSVPWRYTLGAVHAAGPGGLACGLAWASGTWSARHLLAALLGDPSASVRLLAEADLDRDPPAGQ